MSPSKPAHCYGLMQLKILLFDMYIYVTVGLIFLLMPWLHVKYNYYYFKGSLQLINIFQHVECR